MEIDSIKEIGVLLRQIEGMEEVDIDVFLLYIDNLVMIYEDLNKA